MERGGREGVCGAAAACCRRGWVENALPDVPIAAAVCVYDMWSAHPAQVLHLAPYASTGAAVNTFSTSICTGSWATPRPSSARDSQTHSWVRSWRSVPELQLLLLLLSLFLLQSLGLVVNLEFWTERGQCDGQWTDGGDGLQGHEPIFVSREK